MSSDVSISSVLTNQAKTDATKQGLATDFNDFLILLTTQLQNQDPLSPMDSTEFTNQLVAFTSVEQQINTNQKLDNLVALQLGNAFSGAQSYVGKNISYVGSEFSYDGSSANIKYSLGGDATSAKINIVNDDGAVVYTETVPGSMGAHDFVWDGSLTTGGKASSGTYGVEVVAFDENDEIVENTVVVTGKVRGTEVQDGQIFLLVGDRAVPMSSVLNTSATGSDTNVSDALTMALRYIGMDVTFESSKFAYSGSPITLDYTLPDNANTAQAIIRNQSGTIVDRVSVDNTEGKHTFTWDGILPNGSTAANGNYTIEIDAIAPNTAEIVSKAVNYNGDTEIQTAYTLGADEDAVRATVLDAAGNVIYTKSVSRLSGTQTFKWDGQKTDGSTAAAGEYTIKIESVDSTDTHFAGSLLTSGRVDGVEAKDGVIYLNIGSKTVELSKILNVTVPDEDA